MTRFVRAPILLVPFAGLACGSPEIGTRSQDHTANEPTHGTSPFQWHEITDAELDDVVWGTPLADDAPARVRLQEWADELHDRLVTEFPAELAATPRPHVTVMGMELPNAWVMGVPVCIDAKVVVDDAPAGATHAATALLAPMGIFESEMPCFTSSLSTQLDALASFVTERGYTCATSVVDGEIHVSGEHCAVEGWMGDTLGSADQLSVLSAGSRIFMTTALLQLQPEDQVLSVMTHELGHYYRSHITAGEGSFFFYEQAETPAAVTPTAAADSADLVDELSSLLEADEEYPGPAPWIDGATLHPRLAGHLDYVVWTLADFCSSASCDASCATAESLGLTLGYLDPYSMEVDDATAGAYVAFEAELLACGASVVVGDGTGELAAVDLWLDSLLDKLGTDMPEGTLSEVLGELTSGLVALDGVREGFYQELVDRHLGLYTGEQEADDFSLEQLARLGVSPDVTIASQLGLGHVLEDMFGEDEYRKYYGATMDECETMYADGWKDSGGVYQFVSLGTLADPHHGQCYRVFNSDRELAAHAYTTGTAFTPSGPSWDEVVAAIP